MSDKASMETVVAKKDELKHSIWRMHRRKVAGNLMLSVLLLFTVSIIAFAGYKDARMFSFGWSTRVIIAKDSREAIATMYRDNIDTSDARLGSMLHDALDHAMCKQLTFNGGLQWKSEEVSPTCNCLRNMHVEYIKSVTPYGVHLNQTTMERKEDSVLNRVWISNRIRTECFQNIRHTQVEEIADPVSDGLSSSSTFTNIVGFVIYWNVISCLTSAFVFYFDVMTDDPNNDAVEYSSWMKMVFFTVLFLLTVWPLTSLFLFCGLAQSLSMLVICMSFFIFAFMFHGNKLSISSSDNLDRNASRYPARKKIVYWVGYTLTAPVLLMSCNMLMQRRDALYNFTTVFMVVCIGLCSLGSEMVYTAYEHFYISQFRKKSDSAFRSNDVAYDIDNAVLNFREQKNGMVKLNLAVILMLVIGIGCTSFPMFVSTPFSNAYAAIFVSLPIMLVIPPLVTGRIISLVPSSDDAGAGKNNGFASGTTGQTWVLELISIELVARAFFTVPVMYDLYSLGISDNNVISLPQTF